MTAAHRHGERGLTFLEMLATAAILAILASAVLPLAKVTRQRQREIELRRSLREIRTAIDRFNNAAVTQQIAPLDSDCMKPGSEGYPPTLEALVKGCSQVGRIDRKLKFLRRIPVDPMTRGTEWGLRCYQDEPDDTSWCGQNVWDVYTASSGKALDGTLYKDW